MIEFITKVLNFILSCIGAVFAGTIGYSALCGDFGDLPKEVLVIVIGLLAVIFSIEIGIKLYKSKTTYLFGDED